MNDLTANIRMQLSGKSELTLPRDILIELLQMAERREPVLPYMRMADNTSTFVPQFDPPVSNSVDLRFEPGRLVDSPKNLS